MALKGFCCVGDWGDTQNYFAHKVKRIHTRELKYSVSCPYSLNCEVYSVSSKDCIRGSALGVCLCGLTERHGPNSGIGHPHQIEHMNRISFFVCFLFCPLKPYMCNTHCEYTAGSQKFLCTLNRVIGSRKIKHWSGRRVKMLRVAKCLCNLCKKIGNLG